MNADKNTNDDNGVNDDDADTTGVKDGETGTTDTVRGPEHELPLSTHHIPSSTSTHTGKTHTRPLTQINDTIIKGQGSAVHNKSRVRPIVPKSCSFLIRGLNPLLGS